jgi:hypothetical protein
MGTTVRGALLVAGFWMAACAPAPEPALDALRLNDIQVLGSHNSYKERIAPALFEILLEERDTRRIRTLEYGHPPLGEQLDRGLRKLELDVFYDPEGGRYASPRGLAREVEESVAALPAFDPEGLLEEPGFKVLHVQDIDFRSNCLTLRVCLEQLVSWSDGHSGHLPVAITMNTKDGTIEGTSEPLPFSVAAFAALDQEILEVMTRGRLIVPDDVRGDHPDVRHAVLAGGWPTVDEARGRFLFVLDEGGEKRDRYLGESDPPLQGKVLFANLPPEHRGAAFLIINNPIRDAERIRELVEQGFLVRTRADADTREARSGSTERREAAFASGAQFVSTDYYIADPAFENDYRVELPGGGAARCNPVRQPRADCSIVE